MKLFWKGIATVLFYVISGSLVIYAAARSLDFITATLTADQQVIGYLGLAATSGGMIAWLMLFMFKAEGIGQKVTAGIMTVLDMLGEFGLFTMDTLYQSGQAGMIENLTADEIRLVVLALSALIAVNILATVIFHLLEPDNIKRMRESFVRDQLEAKALKEIEQRGEEIAARLAPQIAQQWADEFEARFADMQSLGLGAAAHASARPVTSRPMATQPAVETRAVVASESEAAEMQPVPLAGFSGNGHK
ncbi:MAG: hypothetical protein QY332_14675 [Anaerolineales bacterium]|nr:MAG: hypothetical protein QY332_14675 [Anaerolineales bacterium]